jgi:palmitoyltransferase
MAAEAPGEEKPCLTPQLTAKLLAVAFWFTLNAMVLSVCLADDSDLSEGLLKNELSAQMFLVLVGITGVLYLSAAFMNPGYLDSEPISSASDPEDLSYSGVSETDKDGIPTPGSTDPGTTGEKREKDMKKYAGKVDVTCCGVCPPGMMWSYYKWRRQNEQDEQHFVGDKYCNVCLRGVSLRAKHCSSCDKCVARYDHHCIWLGNCVGERNHGLFWWYLVCQSIAIIWGLYYIETAIKWSGFSSQALGAIEGFIWMNGLKIIIFFFILIWSWLPICLLAYHTYLLTTNQTTWEFNRKTRITYLRGQPAGHRPFDDGPLKNLLLMCCTPKLLDWRKHMDNQDTALTYDDDDETTAP